MADEGRFTAEELDGLLDPDATALARLDDSYASTEPSPLTDRLERGSDDPTRTARLVAAVRRHPRVFAAALVLALVAGLGWQVYARTRPPPISTRLATDAWFMPDPVDLAGVRIIRGQVVSALQVQLAPGITSVTVVALDGPGLGPSTVTQEGTLVTVSNPLNCTNFRGWSTPQPLPFLHLASIDAWGRSVSATLPVSDAPGAGAIPASVVTTTLRQACVGVLADSLQVVGTPRVDAAADPATLTLTLKNPTAAPLLVLGGQASFQPADATIGTSYAAPDPTAPPPSGTVVPAHATVPVVMPVRRNDCGPPTPLPADALPGVPDGRRTGDFTLWVAPPQQVPDDSLDSWTSLRLTAAQRAAVTAALAAPCAGAPRIAYTVAAARSGEDLGTFRIDLRVSAGTPAVKPPLDWFGPLLPEPLTTTARGARHVVAILTVEVLCGTDFAAIPPLTLPATVRAATVDYPYQLRLADLDVLHTLSSICHKVPDLAQARANGWAV